MEIFIDNRQEKIEISEEIHELVKKVIKEVLNYENKSMDCEVSISFVDNHEIKQLNNDYRNINRETDVLSFPMEDEFRHDGPLLLGDIIISVEKALEQAVEFGHSINREIAYLTTHSMFHLLGYNHINEEEKPIMRKKEKEIMKSLKIFKVSKGE